jgi:hypothetical protein
MSMGSLGAKVTAVTVLAALAALSASNTLPPGFTWVPVILAASGNSGEGTGGTDRDPLPGDDEPEGESSF